MKIDHQQLKSFLLDAGLTDEKTFEQALSQANREGKKLEDVLVATANIKSDDLIRLQAYILGIPFVDLENEKVPQEILQIIPESIARANNIIAFRKSGQNLEVAMLDPEDLKTIEFIKKKSDLKILPRLTTPQSIKIVLKQYQAGSLQVEFSDIIKKSQVNLGELSFQGEEIANNQEDALLAKQAQEMPIIKIVDTLLKHAILQRASDIHIEPLEKEVLVRYRVDGILREAMTLPGQTKSGITARIKVLSNLKLDEHRLPQDGRFKINSDDYKYSIRVSILPIADGEKIVLRLLPESNRALGLNELGITGKALRDVQNSLKKPVGMILITGPTGSGKTTTLYSMMEILNQPEVNISTVEDPIEYRMPKINQTQVNPKIGLTFAAGLRSLLRQDPDIIMVGEIRDIETAGLAINAALTGHLVLSTLHTNSAAGAIPRLLDMKVEPFLLTSTLNLVIAQRLVRKLTDEKEKYKLKEKDLKNLADFCDLKRIEEIFKQEKLLKSRETIKDLVFFRPKPSKDVPEGYKGRVGIYEVLAISEEIKGLIEKGASADVLQHKARAEGMKLMLEDGFLKAAQGITSLEEVLRVIVE
ncbi:Flp pilus assembly complex ATPase component TadA [Candidatus Gribaldobacteria bacterium]|nr:Flp pilus assembly complex ATPase component TadA [Candidatus Gribaldobacteria bacterium]